MPGEPNDPRDLWRSQPGEPFRITAAELRGRSEERRKHARERAIVSVVLGIALGVWFGVAVARPAPLVTRLGWAVLSLWSLYFTWHVRRWQWPRGGPGAEASASLDFYRGELEKRRDYGRHIWRRTGLAFCFLGIALVLGPLMAGALQTPQVLSKAAPFFVLLAVWAVLFRRSRRRERELIERELAELRALVGKG